MNNAIRWKQRFSNFQNAYAVFDRQVNAYRLHKLEEIYQLAHEFNERFKNL